METDQARYVITGSLKLAWNRATGTLEEKDIKRERLADLLARVKRGGARPTAADLTEALGDPDDGLTRDALRTWAQQDEAPVIPR